MTYADDISFTTILTFTTWITSREMVKNSPFTLQGVALLKRIGTKLLLK